MAERGGQPGNTNHTDGRVWRAALNRALEKRGRGDRMAALDELAEKLLAKADEADLGALRELADRIEGKPTQEVTGNLGLRVILPLTDAGL